jgi:hypothetical protein
MKKLLILFAFIMLIYYVKANARPRTVTPEWQKCADQAVTTEHMRANTDSDAFIKDLCDFYSKPLPECIAILDGSSDREKVQIFQDYLFQAVILPKCGTPK